MRETAKRSIDRAPIDPTAVQRQMSAARGVKLPALTTLSMPLLVINGERDPIMKVSGGRATARAVPGSRFVSYPDMAHAIPPSRWSSVIDEVARIAGQM